MLYSRKKKPLKVFMFAYWQLRNVTIVFLSCDNIIVEGYCGIILSYFYVVVCNFWVLICIIYYVVNVNELPFYLQHLKYNTIEQNESNYSLFSTITGLVMHIFKPLYILNQRIQLVKYNLWPNKYSPKSCRSFSLRGVRWQDQLHTLCFLLLILFQ